MNSKPTLCEPEQHVWLWSVSLAVTFQNYVIHSDPYQRCDCGEFMWSELMWQKTNARPNLGKDD